MSDRIPPPPPPGYNAGYPQPSYGPPKHPHATTALVLGILGIAACGIVAPFAWVIGGRAVREIDASPETYGGRSEANAGRIMGIIGSVLLALAVVGIVLLVVLALVVGSSSSTDDFDDEYTSLVGTHATVHP
jgi:Mn2+/Fe2+ NRAMP family transporter